MTMYYSRAEMDYVEDQRMKRLMEDISAGKVKLVEDEYGIRSLKYIEPPRVEETSG